MEFSIVICAYTDERWDALLAAIESLRQQRVPPAEIVVAVDHNPQLLERIRARAPDVVAVPNTEQPGLSGARNSGIAATRGEVIAFMDEDASAAPSWLERLAAGYHNPRVLGVGGAIVPAWASGRPGWFPEEFDWVVGCSYRGLPDGAAPVRNLIGCNMSFRRYIFDAVGGFRSGIGRIGSRPAGCEETELCIRLRQHWPQAVLLYEPSAKVYHRVPGSRANWRYFHARCYHEGRSKAAIAAFVGAGDGLASERAYTRRTLPRGFARGVSDALRGEDLAGLARAGAITSGLLATAAGYLAGAVAARRRAAGRPVRAQASASSSGRRSV